MDLSTKQMSLEGCISVEDWPENSCNIHSLLFNPYHVFWGRDGFLWGFSYEKKIFTPKKSSEFVKNST